MVSYQEEPTLGDAARTVPYTSLFMFIIRRVRGHKEGWGGGGRRVMAQRVFFGHPRSDSQMELKRL